jgi:uncharacterized membrane protein
MLSSWFLLGFALVFATLVAAADLYRILDGEPNARVYFVAGF